MKPSLIFSILLLIFSCQPKEQTSFNDFRKEFIKAQGLDKRTTYVGFEERDDSILVEFENKSLKNKFHAYRKESRTFKNTIFNLKVAEPKIAYISNSVSNMRSEPKHSAELSTQYLLGQKVKVYKANESKEWFYVQGEDNYLGWIDHGGILFQDKANQEYTSAPKFIFQKNETTAFLHSNNAEQCCDLVYGNILGKISPNVYILPNGTKIQQNDAHFLPVGSTKNIDAVLARAKSLMGRPYLWGGTSTKGMDCSGFTRTAFQEAGILIGRDASLQVHQGLEIDKNDFSKWKEGDLLFFGNLREDGSQRITHVAIHLKNGRFIHASQKVRIESLNKTHNEFNQHRFETLLRVKRLL